MATTSNKNPAPTEIRLRKVSRVLEISFDNDMRFELPFEYLRVYSPSAEVRGHGAGQEVLQVGKKNVDIVDITGVGNYAIQPNNRVRVFDSSFTVKHELLIERKTNSHIYTVEDNPKWITEDSDRYDYKMEERK